MDFLVLGVVFIAAVGSIALFILKGYGLIILLALLVFMVLW